MTASRRPSLATGSRNPAVAVLGGIVLVVSGLGFPLTQAVIARCGRRGAVVAEGVAVGLLVRDAALVESGLSARLQPLPRRLLSSSADSRSRRCDPARPDRPRLFARRAASNAPLRFQ